MSERRGYDGLAALHFFCLDIRGRSQHLRTSARRAGVGVRRLFAAVTFTVNMPHGRALVGDEIPEVRDRAGADLISLLSLNVDREQLVLCHFAVLVSVR